MDFANRLDTRDFSRRRFLFSSAATSVIALGGPSESSAQTTAPPASFSTLKPLGDRVHPIAPEEFQARVARAQELMGQQNPKFDALLIGPGTSLYYFTGIHWYLSERLLALVIPRSGKPILISPGFEEGRMRESMRYPLEVRVWQEDESPTRMIAGVLTERGMRTARVGIEETLPFTFYDHFRAAAPACEMISADPVTVGCRSDKSPHELDLMRLACTATCDVYREVFANLKEGMSQESIAKLLDAGFERMKLQSEALVLVGASAALPHGSNQPQTLREGDVVLIDGGCILEGYPADITRTAVFGKPSVKIKNVFEVVRIAQDAALDAARAGKLSGSVDDAARTVITSAGYGPGYKYFTHRLGHGLGLDIHEQPYLVHGSTTLLEPSMTFSNEPGIYIPGEFGLRCEDDMVIAANGPAQLLSPGFQVSLEKPLG
jgi:Xaa-Pro dipeptidase